MDFTPTPAQRTLSELTRRILADHGGAERLRLLDQASPNDRFDPKLWDTLAETGVLGAALPESAGGDGHDLLEQCSVLIELGRELAPVPYLATVAAGGAAVARFGTGPQQVWVKAVLHGRMRLAVALIEPDGSDPLTPSTRAEPTPSGWVLAGTKTTVLSGPSADLLLVSATAPDGPALFAVWPDDPGVRVLRQHMIDHDDAGLIEFTDVRLPSDRRLGRAGTTEPRPSTAEPGHAPGPAEVTRPTADESAVEPVAWVLRRATVALCAHQLGVLERALELTAEYATTRTQFDRPIGTFQAVAQRLADAYIQVQALRLALWNAAWTLDAGSPPSSASLSEAEVVAAVATAKFWAAEAGHYVAHTCVHVHGGAGIDVEQPIHRYFLAAKRAEFELGSATTHLLTLGATLAE